MVCIGIRITIGQSRSNILMCKIDRITGIEISLEYVHHKGRVHGRVKGDYNMSCGN